jgi:hypothetical protein
LIKLFVCSLIVANLFSYELKPLWYPSKKDGIKLAYGDGKTFNNALDNAIDEINIDNNSTSQITKLDIAIVKKELLKEHNFLKIKHNNKSILEQIKEELVNNSSSKRYETDKYLLKTKLLKDLNSTFSYFPDIKIYGNHLYLNDKKFILKNNDFPNILVENKSNDIKLNMSKNIENNKKYFVEIKVQTKGYVSLIEVINSKKLNILFSNKILAENKNTIYPNFKDSDGLEIILPKNTIKAKIMTIAVICTKKKEFEETLFLTELIERIHDCSYSSVVSEVK